MNRIVMSSSKGNAAQFALLETRRMAFAEWVNFPDCPFQRNTEARALSARHLKNFDDSHRRVTIALLPTGECYKIDGHTRAFLWARGLAENVPTPLWLTVDVYECSSRAPDALGALYDRFDSRVSAKTAADDVHSASHELDLHFSSALMQRGRYGTAVKRLYNLAKGYGGAAKSGGPQFTYTCIEYFRPELVLFDATDPKHSDYIVPFMMSALLTFMKYGADASEFWTKYGENKGSKTKNGVDGVQAARNFLSEVRRLALHGQQHDFASIGKIINAFERYRIRELYTGKSGLPQPKDQSELERYIDLAVRAKDKLV